MDADKITLASYIVYLQSMYKRYGNISIAQLKHIERNRKNLFYIAFMGGVIGYLIGKYWKKK